MPDQERRPNLGRRKLLVELAAFTGVVAASTLVTHQLDLLDPNQEETEEQQKLRQMLNTVKEADDDVATAPDETNVRKRADAVIEALKLLSPDAAVSFLENERKIREKIQDNNPDHSLKELVEHPVQLHGKANEMSPMGDLVFQDESGIYHAVLNQAAIKSQGAEIELTGWVIKTGLYIFSTDESP